MSNEQLVKSAHIWAVVVVLLFAVIVFAGTTGSNRTHLAQNANSNSNTSRNQNQNRNANTVNRNANNTNASGEQAATSALSARDQKFLTEAAMGGLMEVELGRWAAQKGTSAEVKQFGQRMVDDHGNANTELAQLASSKGVTLPAQLDEKHQNEASKITRLAGGAEFDKAYSKMMLKDHEKDVSAFEKASTSAGDADIKAFAAKTLPTLQEHLQMAKALPANAKSSDNSNRNTNRSSNSNGNSNRP